MLRTLVVAASAAAVLAACPNSCSGKGVCDEHEVCHCFKAPGTPFQALFTGADCSLRVCPYGRAHDLITDATQQLQPVWGASNPTVGFIPASPGSVAKLRAFVNGGTLLESDLGVDVRVVKKDASTSTLKFQIKTSDQKTFGAEIEASADSTARLYTSREVSYQVTTDGVGATGVFLYFDVGSVSDLAGVAEGDRYFFNISANKGMRFVDSDGNTAHQYAECSGRGSCDRGTGACKCAEGFTGDACHRTKCANDCSGHGRCQQQKYFVSDAAADAGLANLKYDLAFDADSRYGCKCDDGYRGHDCSMRECPSGPDPLGGDGGAEGMDCSGRGACNYQTGLCSCTKGFHDERCGTQTTLR